MEKEKKLRDLSSLSNEKIIKLYNEAISALETAELFEMIFQKGEELEKIGKYKFISEQLKKEIEKRG